MAYKFEFDDLSFSGIVNVIDGNETTAKEYLIENYAKIHDQKKIVEDLKQKLNNEEAYLKRLEGSVDLVFHHMKFKKPMALIVGEETKEIIFISEAGITLEKNVL